MSPDVLLCFRHFSRVVGIPMAIIATPAQLKLLCRLPVLSRPVDCVNGGLISPRVTFGAAPNKETEEGG